jgi:hypothetical protein
VFLNWNPEYAGAAIAGTPDRILKTFGYFPPWSLAHILAVPLALASVVEAGVWAAGHTMPAAGRLYTVAQTTQQRIPRAILGALYLGWLLQALVLQQPHDYIHVPETILAFAVIACQGWAVGLVLLGAALVSSAWIIADTENKSDLSEFRGLTPLLEITRHPLTDPHVLLCWPRCWTEPGSLPLRDDLASQGRNAGGTRWEHLARVEAFLRTIDPPLRDHELTCWNDGTHSLYLSLGLEPSARYMHYGTAFRFKRHTEDIRREVAASRQRYVVTDLVGLHMRMGDLLKTNVQRESPGAPALDGRPNGLPFWFPRSQVALFPWNQPVVFRSGRYLVHRVDGPVAPGQIANPAEQMEAGSGPGINSWTGEVPDDIPGPLPGGGSGSTTIVLNEATFANAYNRLKFAPEVPRVDFTQFLVVIKLTRTRSSGLTTELDPETGNLSVGLGWAVGAGEKLRYYVLAYPRAGVKSVAGFPISKP